MNQDLKNFIAEVVTRAVAPTLLLVATVSFISLPLALGDAHRGIDNAPQAQAGHMT